MSTICDDLRAAILQAAMRGQLTSSDSDAWEESTIDDICDLCTGNSIPESIKKSKYMKIAEGRNYIGTKDVLFDHSFNYENGVKIPYNEGNFRIAKAGDILLCIEGGSAGRKIGILEEDVCYGNKLCKFSPINVIKNKFLYYYIQSPLFQDQFSENMTGIIGGVSIKKIKAILIKYPSLDEQEKIINKIDSLMARVVGLEESANTLMSLKKTFPDDIKASLLQAAMQGKLTKQLPEDGSAEDLLEEIKAEKEKLIAEGKIKKQKPLMPIVDDKILFDIPENWRWAYINDIAYVTKLAGFEYTKYMSGAIKSTGDVPIVRAKNIKPGQFIENKDEFITYELSKQLDRCALDKRCVLMTFIGAGIGEVAVFDNIHRNHLAPNVAKIVPHLDMCQYLMYYFMSPIGRSEIFQFMKAVAQPSLSMETIRKIRVPLPPLAEQKRIVERLDVLMQNVNVVGDLIASE
ncbi:restriction endonuclease subunit S [Candidatus Saccharibacteria bacterium]|nr:restriction endonuclease subunit S [Candidatus Saccharibacteria bacterium]